VSGVALLAGTVMLAPSLAVTPLHEDPSAQAWLSIAVLGIVCSALAFVVFFALIVEAGPTRASVVTYLNPAVAVLLGVAVLGERIGAASIAGLGLIFAGSWTATGGDVYALRRRLSRSRTAGHSEARIEK
jgi:drug/metabolite transporter (DMT)-like permease